VGVQAQNITYFWVMNERAANFCIGRHLSCRRVLEALDDGLHRQHMKAIVGRDSKYLAKDTYRLAAPIVSDDDGEGRVEFDYLDMLVVKAANASNGEFVERGPAV
jgi:hypothetical protein